MKIYRPVESPRISQYFGENKACAKTNLNGQPFLPFIIKDKTSINVCPIGFKNFYGLLSMKGHNGYDFASPAGAGVYFNIVADTEWYCKTEVDTSGGIGLNVYCTRPIYFKELPEGAGERAKAIFKEKNGYMRVKFKFWHASKNLVKDGDKVLPGHLIQFVGATGAASGPHVHFGMKFINIENDDPIDKDNGYRAVVNHTMFYENMFILKYMGIAEPSVVALMAEKLRWLVIFFENLLANKKNI